MGKRGAGGSPVPDTDAADVLGVPVRTIEGWRRSLLDTGHVTMWREPGGRWRKRAGLAHPAERFTMVPAILLRAVLGRHISRLAFRLHITITHHRIRSTERPDDPADAGCWWGIGRLARLVGGRERPRIAAALAELVGASLLRIEESGNGRPRRLVPLFVRAVRQVMTAAMRAADRIARRAAGRLVRPVLAAVTTPPANTRYYPPGISAVARPAGTPNAPLGPGTGASGPGPYLSVEDLRVGTPPLTAEEWEHLPEAERRRMRRRAPGRLPPGALGSGDVTG